MTSVSLIGMRKGPMTKVLRVRIASTNKWNARRLLSPSTAEKLPSLGNAHFVTYPPYIT